jgi:hypothetical protein
MIAFEGKLNDLEDEGIILSYFEMFLKKIYCKQTNN